MVKFQILENYLTEHNVQSAASDVLKSIEGPFAELLRHLIYEHSPLGTEYVYEVLDLLVMEHRQKQSSVVAP